MKFDDFVQAFADQIDGLWAAMLTDISIVTNAGRQDVSRHGGPSRRPTGRRAAERDLKAERRERRTAED